MTILFLNVKETNLHAESTLIAFTCQAL